MNLNDIDCIMDDTYYPSTHDIEEVLRVSLVHVQIITHDLENFEQWIAQEYHNHDALPIVQGLMKLIHHD